MLLILRYIFIFINWTLFRLFSSVWLKYWVMDFREALQFMGQRAGLLPCSQEHTEFHSFSQKYALSFNSFFLSKKKKKSDQIHNLYRTHARGESTAEILMFNLDTV